MLSVLGRCAASTFTRTFTSFTKIIHSFCQPIHLQVGFCGMYQLPTRSKLFLRSKLIATPRHYSIRDVQSSQIVVIKKISPG